MSEIKNLELTNENRKHLLDDIIDLEFKINSHWNIIFELRKSSDQNIAKQNLLLFEIDNKRNEIDKIRVVLINNKFNFIDTKNLI